MKNPSSKKYISWGVTAFCVIAVSIVLYFVFARMDVITKGLGRLMSILRPFAYGLAFAYLLVPFFNFCYKKLEAPMQRCFKKRKAAARATKVLSTTISFAAAVAVVVGLISLVIPQLVKNIASFANADLPAYAEDIYKWLEQTLENNPDVEAWALKLYNEATTGLATWLKSDMLPQMTSVMNGLLGTLAVFKDLLIGAIITIYVLNSKDAFSAQAKKLAYSCLSVKKANLIVDNTRYVNHVFGRFISGKLLDSLIIGIICFVGMSFMKLPYVMLVSVIIGVTNIIPFFGPFIGAIPSAILIALDDPFKCLYFMVFIIILQQVDGNIIGPRILGGSTGLSSFWVMFAILLFGGVFGFVGMVIGVPFFAVIYSIVSGLVNRSLRRRRLPDETQSYYDLDHIDEGTGQMVHDADMPPTQRFNFPGDKPREFGAKSDQSDEKPPNGKAP